MQKAWCELVDEKVREIRQGERRDGDAFERLVKELEDHWSLERWHIAPLAYSRAAEFRFRDQTVFRLSVSGGAIHVKAGEDRKSFELETEEGEMREWTASLMARAVHLNGALEVEVED